MNPTKYKGYQISTLASYNTPYYYAVSTLKGLGSVNHFQTVKRLTNHIDRLIKAGKIRDLSVNPDECQF